MSFITFLFYLLKKISEIITLNHIVTQGASKLYNLFIYKETISIKPQYNLVQTITFLLRPSKKNVLVLTMDLKKKGKVGRVYIFCFYFQSNMGRVFIFCFYFQRFKNIKQTNSILLFWQANNTIVFTWRDLDFPTNTSFFRSKLTKGLLFSPASFMSVKSSTNILLHNSVTVIVLSTGRKVHRIICLERNCTLKLMRSVFTRSHAEFLVSFSIDQSFKRLSKLVCVTGTLKNLNLQ